MSDHLLGRISLPLLALMLLAALSACSANGEDDSGTHYQTVRGDLCERLDIRGLSRHDSITVERISDSSSPEGTSASCSIRWTDWNAERNDGALGVSLRIFDSNEGAKEEFDRLDAVSLTLAPNNWERRDDKTTAQGWWTTSSLRLVTRDEASSTRTRQRRFQLYLDENLLVVVTAVHDLATPAPRHERMEATTIDGVLTAVEEERDYME